VDEIVTEYVEAIGGLDAHKKHTTRKLEGLFTFVATNTPPWRMSITQKAPNLTHTWIEIPNHGEFTEGYDGTVAWKSEPNKGVHLAQGGELKQKQRDARFYGYVELKSQYQTLAVAGQEEVKGKVYDVLEGTFEDGSKETLYLDAQTHLLGLIKRKGSRVAIELNDYREQDGIQIASSVIIKHDSKTVVIMKIENVTHGIDVDDAIFAMPQGGAALGAADRRRQQAERGGERGGRRFTEGSTLLYVQPLMQTLDTNANVTIEEKELEAGFLAMLDQHSQSYTMLLKLFDGDADGTLGKKEGQAAREFVFGLGKILLYDANRDWKVDDAEADKAWDQWSEAYERHNAGVLERFDKDRNGELSPEEAKIGLKQIRRRR